MASGVGKGPDKETPKKNMPLGKGKKPLGKDIPSHKYSISAVHILWVSTCIALIIALYLAYLEAVSAASILDYVLPRINVNVTQIGNTTEITEIVPEQIHAPFVPRFVLIWGFIGAATYLLKVTTTKLTHAGFDEKKIPEHISRLFIGTTLAVVSYFTLSTGGFFGLTIDVTKISHPGLIQYVYAVISFISGYSVRHIIQILSNIANSMFMIQTPEDKRAHEIVAHEKIAQEKIAEEQKATKKETTTEK